MELNAIIPSSLPKDYRKSLINFGNGRYFNLPYKSSVNEHYVEKHERLLPTSSPASLIFNSSGQEIVFTVSNKIDMILGGYLQLDLINTHVTAATTQVISAIAVTKSSSTTVDIAAGNYIIDFPSLGVRTDYLAYNTSVANAQIAVRALHTDLASVTVTGYPFSASATSGAMVLTLTGLIESIPVNFIEYNFVDATPLEATIQMTLTAFATGGSLKFGASPVLIDYYDQTINGVPLERVYGPAIYHDVVLHRKSEELTHLGKLMKYDFENDKSTAFINGASGTLTVYIPIVGFLMDQQTLLPSMIPRSKIEYRFTMASSNSIFDSTSGTTATRANITLSAAYLWITHKDIPDEYASMLWKQYGGGLGAERLLHYRQYQFQEKVIDSRTSLTAATQYTCLLSIVGDVSKILFVLRPSAKTYSSYYTKPLALTYLEVRDSRDNTLQGADFIGHTYMKEVIVPSRYPEMHINAADKTNYYIWSPSEKPLESRETGSLMGIYRCLGQDIIKYTPTATSSVATELVAYYVSLRVLEIDVSTGDVKFQ